MKKENTELKIGEIGNLSDLISGQYAQVLNVNLKNTAVKNRLIGMGLIKGTTLQIKNPAPFGDPMQISLRGYILALRKSLADEIKVVVIDKNKHNERTL